ncbi:histidine kinase [Clostridium beijerinckii]|nr:histidine kinase [Clostridium beijerinckii]
MYRSKDDVAMLDKNIELNINNYKELWDKINELAFVLEVDELFAPKCFIDVNSKACSSLGYSKENFTDLKPSDIFIFDKKGTVLELYRNIIHKRCDKVDMMLKSKCGKYIYVEANIFYFIDNKKKYILIIAIDVTKNKNIVKNINGIMKGIPDIIRVYNPDYTIAFFNEAAYSFYNTTPQEVKGKMCYEILSRKEKCINCYFEEVIKTKQMITKERYIPEVNKFMDICYNPVLDEDGEILFIVERLRDITEKKILDKILQDGKKRYKQILNNFHDPIVIIVDNKIVLANQEACNLIGLDHSEIIDSNVYKYFQDKHIKALHKRFRNIISQKKIKDTYDYEFDFSDSKLTNLQISCSYIEDDGNPAILAVIRDITKIKQELNKAADLQRKTLQKCFPAEEFINTVSIYVPANTISGDFYHIHKISEELIIGIVIDVRGKGVSAALNISALDILFLQEMAITHDPINIVNNLNKKLVTYYEENYIAVCCFSMDFNKKELKVVGAGINQFIFQKKDKDVEEKIIEGAFLGMFENSEFSEMIISFESGDRVFFFSDGLDFILDEDKIVQRYMKKVSIYKFKEYIDEFLDDTILENGKLEDDCTMIAIEIK